MAKAKVTEKNIKLILQGSMGKAILALAVPVVINSFLQTMYNLTDTYWLGQLGTNELAAINLVSPLQQIVVNFGSGLTVAGAVLIAQLIGASKKDIARVFNAETFIVGFISGIIGIGITMLLTIPINAIVYALSGVTIHAMVPPKAAIILVLISMFLTIIAGLIPAKMASKKDPVEALRTE